MKVLSKYNSYKNSEVVWLGNVPEHWEIVKSKRILVEASIKGFPDEELLAATQTKGVIPKSLYENTTVTATKNFETLKLVEKGDFVISLRSFQGGIEYAHYRGIISPAYTILKPQEEVVHKYYRYLLKSKRYISGLTLLVTGIREGQNIDTGKFKDSYLPLPTKPEQTVIANFLDYKLEKIERFISKKKQLIELLNEQKAAIINQAVTKGLNPNAKMKPSGIEWLGDIPEHWEVRKLKFVGKIRNGATPSTSQKEYWDGKIVWTTPAEINNLVYINNSTRKISNEGYNSCGTHLVPKNSIILTTRAPIGKVAISGVELCTNQGCKSIVLEDIIVKFIYFQMIIYKDEMNSLGRGTTFMELSNEALKNIKLPIPSNIEQNSIVQYIETETAKIEKTITTIEKEIDLVEEYKTALIAEAVTGKIDVRDFEMPQEETPLAMVAEEAVSYNKEN